MGLLRTEGFDKLLGMVADEATEMVSASRAIRHLATIGERLAPEVALGALRSSERFLLDAIDAAEALVNPLTAQQVDAYRIVGTKPGKAAILRPGEEFDGDDRPLAGIDWPAGTFEDLEAECKRLDQRDEAEVEACRDWLREQGEDHAAGLLSRLRYILRHVGPIRLYIGNDVYTNLGRDSNLLGKSVSDVSDRCRMNVLTTNPLSEWGAADACFVVCMSALIGSGTPSRTEEFSGTQLLPGRLRRFLEDRVRAYGGSVPRTAADTVLIGELFELADRARELRAAKLAAGAGVYRTVQAMTINKTEHFFDTRINGTDVPEAFLDELSGLVPASVGGVRASESVGFEVDWSPVLEADPEPREPGYSSRFEEVLHGLVAAAAEGTESDVSMSRGPKDLLRLSELLTERSVEPGHWKTADYYCCVVPAEHFRRRLIDAGAAAEVAQVVRAIAARMRWNCWHFMPHGADVVDDPSLADRDWFFAPSMPDMTEWTSHHHQGHVANGVRHAIRVPFGITLAGKLRPGIHDLRLMRSEGEVYTLTELRAAVAMGEILRGYYQQQAARLEKRREPFVLNDFGNTWYQARYGVSAPADKGRSAEVRAGADYE